MCRTYGKPNSDHAMGCEEVRQEASPSLWEEARRRVVLGTAAVAPPALLSLLEWWSRH